MFPSKSRDARAGNGAAAEPASTSDGEAALAEERLSHLKPKYPDHRVTGQPAPNAAVSVAEDPGALLIGGGVELKGRIGSCDALVVEGTVESTIECRSIEIRASGVVTGEATVESATIMGRFEGDLVVTGCLTVRAGGRISGSVRYGEIEIERGAEITGDIGPVVAEAQGDSAAAPDHAPPKDRAAEELAARVEAL